MDLGLTGRKAIITGGTRGIGRRTAEVLADERTAVGLCACNGAEVDEAVEALEARGVTAFGRALDVADGAEEATADVTLRDLLPEDLGYVTYDGLLTTPPCSEGVRWIVLTAPVELSAEQIDAFSLTRRVEIRSWRRPPRSDNQPGTGSRPQYQSQMPVAAREFHAAWATAQAVSRPPRQRKSSVSARPPKTPESITPATPW